MNAAHFDASKRLAAHLRIQGYKCWVEAQRVGKWTYGDSPRVDVLAIRPWSGKDTEVIAFEVKVSVADMRRDLTASKWRAYYETLGIPRVILACANGVVPTVGEIPADLGLWIEEKSLLGNYSWKRKSMGRKMHGDLRKLDPLLLMWCLSMKGDETSGIQWNPEKSRMERLRRQVPPAAMKIIDADIPLRDDYQMRDMLEKIAAKRGAQYAVKVHHLLYGKLEDVGSKVSKWATEVVKAVAIARGEDPDALMDRFGSGQYLGDDLDNLAHAVRHATVLTKHADRVRRIASGLSALAYGWRDDERMDTELAEAEEAATGEPVALVVSRRRKAS